MELLAYLLNDYSTSEVALLLVALQYAVLGPAWVVASLVMPVERRTAGWWAAYACGSALGLLLIVVAMHIGHAPMRALGNVLVLAATLALQRGLWLFAGQRCWTAVQLAVLATIIGLNWLALEPSWVWARIAFGSALWGAVYLWAGFDIWRHVRLNMQQRWGLLYATPLLLGGLLLSVRGVRGLVAPESVIYEVEQNTVLSVGSSLTGLVAALLLQMMLVGLLVSRLVGRLEKLSRHDHVTGLLNRGAMVELLDQEVHRARRLGGPASGQGSNQDGGRMAVLMIDVDYFKQINDDHGHVAGDRALQHLAAVMGAQLREVDHLARWGGDEFLALLPDSSPDDARVLAQRLCDRVRELALVIDGERLPLTVSIGVAGWLGPQDNVLALLNRADINLYQGKNDGRGRVGPLAPPVGPRRAAALKSV